MFVTTFITASTTNKQTTPHGCVILAQNVRLRDKTGHCAHLAFIVARRKPEASLPDKLLSSPKMQAHTSHIILAHGLELLWGDEACIGVRSALGQHLPDGPVGCRAVSEGLLQGLVLQLLPPTRQTRDLQSKSNMC